MPAGERAPVDVAVGEQRQRVVDLGRRVVKGAADVELGVVQRAEGSVTSLPAGQPPTSTTVAPGAAAAIAAPRPAGARRPP